MSLLVRVLSVLAAIAVVVLCYFVTVWVLGMLSIHPPAEVLTAAFVLIGLLAAIGALSGRFDSIWPPQL